MVLVVPKIFLNSYCFFLLTGIFVLIVGGGSSENRHDDQMELSLWSFCARRTNWERMGVERT